MTFTHEIKAEVISDSISPDGVRLTTISTTYNRFAMPEIMMHREQSRSSASSRAIPFETMLERAIQHPAPFVEYPAEQKGMQGGALLAGNDLYDAEILFEDIQDFLGLKIIHTHHRGAVRKGRHRRENQPEAMEKRHAQHQAVFR